jgi:hypothetical protein
MQILGIQIDKPLIRAALLKKGPKGMEILALQTSSLADPDDVKLLYTPKFRGRIVSGLSAKDLLVRNLELKVEGSKHVEEALIFQSESTSYFGAGETLVVPHRVKKRASAIDSLLFTAPRAAIRSHLTDLAQIGADPDLLSANSLGLVHYARWKQPALEDAYLVDLGSSDWTCVLMEKGELKKSHSLSMGNETLFSALWEDRKKILLPKDVEGVAKQIDLLQLKSHLNPHLSAKLNEMRQELAKVIFSFRRGQDPIPLLFSGNTEAFGHLKEYLLESLQGIVSTESAASPPSEEQKYAIPIGLALEKNHSSLQLLREEFFPKKLWRRAGLYSLLLFAASLSLAGLLLWEGFRRFDSRRSHMIESLHASLEKWDPQLKRAIFLEGSDEEAILDRWTHAIDKHSKEYPYIQLSPKLSEFFSWFSKHPLLQQFAEEGDPLNLLELRYQLAQFPNSESPSQPYVAKVELRFAVNSPMNARKFHEALIQGDEMIDSKSEVKWESFSNGYRASFGLKNRSPNVP